jgi:hypothetical protein
MDSERRPRVPTWWANIFAGRRKGYSDRVLPLGCVHDICREYCEREKLCVTVTPTEFIYVGGSEPGVIVGLIQDPRSPKPTSMLVSHAFALGELLRVKLGQHRVTVQFPAETVLLGERE